MSPPKYDNAWYRRRAKEMYGSKSITIEDDAVAEVLDGSTVEAWVQAWVRVPLEPEWVGKVSLWLESKHPHNTPWLKVRHHHKDEDALLLTDDVKEALGGIGWGPQEFEAPPMADSDGYVEFVLLSPDGKGIFNMWEEDEHDPFMLALQEKLDGLGFGLPPWFHLSYQDLA